MALYKLQIENCNIFDVSPKASNLGEPGVL